MRQVRGHRDRSPLLGRRRLLVLQLLSEAAAGEDLVCVEDFE